MVGIAMLMIALLNYVDIIVYGCYNINEIDIGVYF